VFLVENAPAYNRFCANPLVTGEPGIKFYAGAFLIATEGHKLGTLCVIDRNVNKLQPGQQAILTDLAALVMDQLEFGRLKALILAREGA
jgi:GAF domain-containing protein